MTSPAGSTVGVSFPSERILRMEVHSSEIKNFGTFTVPIMRLIFGGIFVFAGVSKILHPADFAQAVYNYQILPDALINLTAIVLPWLELILGVFLIAGLWLPGSLLLSNLLMVVFFGTLVFNLARGLDVHCGCFSTSTEALTGVSMIGYLIRDALFLLLGGYLFYRFCITGDRRSETNPE